MMAGSRTVHDQEKLTNHFFETAGCAINDVDCLRALSHEEYAELSDAAGKIMNNEFVAMVFNTAYSPVHNSDMFRSSMFQDIADGLIKPNTDVMWAYSRDESWGSTKGFWNGLFRPGGLLNDVDDEQAASLGVTASEPTYLELWNRVFGSAYAQDIVAAFPCVENECLHGLSDFIVATQWVCSARYAWAKNWGQRDDVGNLYAFQYEQPTCEEDADGVDTKVCHCGEGGVFRGKTNTPIGDRFAVAMTSFLATGHTDGLAPFLDSDGNYNINAVSYDKWAVESFDTHHCDLLDRLHEDFNWYNWGITNIDDPSLVENQN